MFFVVVFFNFLFVICHKAVIYVDRNTTSMNKLQVALKYTFDLDQPL